MNGQHAVCGLCGYVWHGAHACNTGAFPVMSEKPYEGPGVGAICSRCGSLYCFTPGTCGLSFAHERIVAAAIQYDGLVFSLAAPARHAHIFRSMQSVGLMKNIDGPDMLREQGFLTSLGRYVNREEGADLARAAGQLSGRVKTGGERTLYSEDLW